MLISKFDLCRSEWLELVFAKRNKEYGAYYLRQHYAGNMVKAMGITFLSITAAFVAGGVIMKSNTIMPKLQETVVALTTINPIAPPKADEPKPQAARRPSSSQQFLVPVVTSNPVTVEPTKLANNVPVGPETIDLTGIDAIGQVNLAPETGSGTATKPAESNTVYNTAGLEVMPEPYGGAAGWSKFLQKNLRYPGQASDAGVSGKVWVSFIVEKDGQISNIVVDKGAGYGMDEEALRVLKLSKAWKPGMQNGQPVRVRYTLPLNFVLSE